MRASPKATGPVFRPPLCLHRVHRSSDGWAPRWAKDTAAQAWPGVIRKEVSEYLKCSTGRLDTV